MLIIKDGLSSPNSVFAVRFAHPNAFGTSQTHEPLGEMFATGHKI